MWLRLSNLKGNKTMLSSKIRKWSNNILIKISPPYSWNFCTTPDYRVSWSHPSCSGSTHPSSMWSSSASLRNAPGCEFLSWKPADRPLWVRQAVIVRGRVKNTAQNDQQATSYWDNTLWRTASKQLHIQVTRFPCERHWATPIMAGKTADQHCLEVNVA